MPQTSGNASVRTCLIVEDSTYDQRMMARTVRAVMSPVEVRFAATLEEARLALATIRVSFILLDNNLPDGKGANFAMELAQDARYGRIPVIIVSDWPSPFMWEKAALAGVRKVLMKSDFTASAFTSALPRQITLH
ncbi:response regulator [Seohaeicola zhoushanensis]|uniref:Response regulatory domain-containing protein n=1 Tax=Seohaeicola zhoushanensis TaxID=1569283 RepID=A0A8J3GVZ4_9RHOB|nr:response regulator [Seohaeicola zhoushanensis]GHF41521.1 hypothetical protein GCM10017056_11430 [Seohaeicola zhoushanensis]